MFSEMASYPICGTGITVAYRDWTGEGDTLAMACHNLRERLTRWGATIAPESEVIVGAPGSCSILSTWGDVLHKVRGAHHA
jgi:hypothetical protein